MLRGGLAGDDEDTGTDDRADAQQDQMTGGQSALERRLAFDTAIGYFTRIHMRRSLDRVGRKKVFQHVSPLKP